MSNRYVILENRGLLRLLGKDARSFLQGLTTQDIETVTFFHSAYSALLNAQGKYLHDFFIIAQENGLLLECDRASLPVLQRLLTLYKLRADVAVEDVSGSYHILALIGDMDVLALPETPGRTERFQNGALIAFIDPRLAKLGARVIAAAGEGETWVLQRGFAQALPTDYDAHRLALGIPESGIDHVREKTLILENGFEELNGVSFDKGCYVGQEVTARTKHRAHLHKLLYTVQGDTLPEPGTPVTQGDRTVGEMRSSHGKTGLALLRTQAVENKEPLHAGECAITAANPSWRHG